MIKVSAEEYKVIVKYVYEVAGITLEANKSYLVETRLGPLLEEFGCVSFSELYYKAKADHSGAIQKQVVNAITTQETLFFRDKTPFEVLQHKILPDIIDVKMANHNGIGKIPLRIWSAACSTGQEAYSTAMIVKEMLPDMSKFDIKIVGTDISDAAVAAASRGQYSKFEIDRGLAADKLQRYFEPHGDDWKIKDELRALASFQKYNLFDDLKRLGQFDVVFCRNVAIYFSIDDRKDLFSRISRVMYPHGALLIGSSEYLAGICDMFEPQRHVRAVYYQVKSASASASPTPSAAPARSAMRTQSTAATPKPSPLSTRMSKSSLSTRLGASTPSPLKRPVTASAPQSATLGGLSAGSTARTASPSPRPLSPSSSRLSKPVKSAGIK